MVKFRFYCVLLWLQYKLGLTVQELRGLRWNSSCHCNSLEDHLEGAVVEGVSAHHPHDLVLHYNLMRSPGKGRAKGLDAGKDPEGLC